MLKLILDRQYNTVSDGVKGVVAISGAYNIVRLANASVFGALVVHPVFGSTVQGWREASIMQPLHTAVTPALPLLLLNASDDFHLAVDTAELKKWLEDKGYVSL